MLRIIDRDSYSLKSIRYAYFLRHHWLIRPRVRWPTSDDHSWNQDVFFSKIEKLESRPCILKVRLTDRSRLILHLCTFFLHGIPSNDSHKTDSRNAELSRVNWYETGTTFRNDKIRQVAQRIEITRCDHHTWISRQREWRLGCDCHLWISSLILDTVVWLVYNAHCKRSMMYLETWFVSDAQFSWILSFNQYGCWRISLLISLSLIWSNLRCSFVYFSYSMTMDMIFVMRMNLPPIV